MGQKPGVFECLKKSMSKKTPVTMSSEEYKTMLANGRGYDARLQNSLLTYTMVDTAVS